MRNQLIKNNAPVQVGARAKSCLNTVFIHFIYRVADPGIMVGSVSGSWKSSDPEPKFGKKPDPNFIWSDKNPDLKFMRSDRIRSLILSGRIRIRI